MYTKNLTNDLRLRLNDKDMAFLTELSNSRDVSVSEVIRSIIGEYRRSLETMECLKKAMAITNDVMEKLKTEEMSHDGDTKTNINNKL